MVGNVVRSVWGILVSGFLVIFVGLVVTVMGK